MPTTNQEGAGRAPQPKSNQGAPRLLKPDRAQLFLDPIEFDSLVPADHPARVVWAVLVQEKVEKRKNGKEKKVRVLDLSAFYEPLRARGSDPGRPAIDPLILIALWLYAAIDGVGSGRELARLCEVHDAYRWICGGVSVNYHTLNDFRVGHEAALDELFTNLLTVLLHNGAVTLNRVSHDGTRIRASAGSSSFHRRPTLETALAEVQKHLADLRNQADVECSAQQRAAQERAARDRATRVEAAMAELPKLEAARAESKDSRSKGKPIRISSTDPEARTMRMADGGFRPAYNAQLAVDTGSNAIVGVGVTNVGSDCNGATSMIEQIERRSGRRPNEYLMDNDFVGLESIEEAEHNGTKVYAPVAKSKKGDGAEFVRKKGDSDEVADWRQRMGTDEAKEIYKERCSTVERVNADLKAHRGLTAFRVRGLKKVRCVVLLTAIAYNIMHCSGALLS